MKKKEEINEKDFLILESLRLLLKNREFMGFEKDPFATKKRSLENKIGKFLNYNDI